MRNRIPVAICDQTIILNEQKQKTKKKDEIIQYDDKGEQLFSSDQLLQKKSIGRIVSRLVTPGTLIDENFLEPRKNNYLVAIDHEQVRTIEIVNIIIDEAVFLL